MTGLFLFPDSQTRDPDVESWLRARAGELGTLVQFWFQIIRDSGGDVRELMHDDHPTACVGEAAFAYVNVFKTHMNIGFYRGAELDDPNGLLQGTGKLMRHVKLRPDDDIDEHALRELITTAYADMEVRLDQR